MKTCCLLLAGLGFSISVQAQFRDSVYVIPKRDESKLKSCTPVSPGTRLLSENKLGKIYSLPLDNMHCLVPNLKNVALIPTRKSDEQNGQMPNGKPKLSF